MSCRPGLAPCRSPPRQRAEALVHTGAVRKTRRVSPVSLPPAQGKRFAGLNRAGHCRPPCHLPVTSPSPPRHLPVTSLSPPLRPAATLCPWHWFLRKPQCTWPPPRGCSSVLQASTRLSFRSPAARDLPKQAPRHKGAEKVDRHRSKPCRSWWEKPREKRKDILLVAVVLGRVSPGTATGCDQTFAFNYGLDPTWERVME